MRSRWAALGAAWAATAMIGAAAAEPSVADLVARSREAAAKTTPATVAARLPGRFEDYPSGPLPPGRVVSLPTGDERIRALLPLGEGALLAATSEQVVAISGTGPARKVLEGGATALLPDEGGRRILVNGTGSDGIVVLGTGSLSVESRIRPSEGGHPFAFWGDRAGSVLLGREMIDWRADSPRRILVVLTEAGTEGAREAVPEWSASQFAALGHVAPVGLMWGHLAMRGMIDPYPAPIIRIESGRASRQVTTPPEATADVSPTGGRDGRLYWVRTRGRNGPTGRLFSRDLSDGAAVERPLTGVPTRLVAASADGAEVAFVTIAVERRANASPTWRETVWLASSEALLATDVESVGGRDRAFEASLRELGKTVREAYALTGHAERSKEAAEGPGEGAPPPTPEDLEVMGRALLAGLDASFGTGALTPGEAVPALDALLPHAAGVLTDAPSDVLAVAGVFTLALRESGAGTLVLDTATGELSAPLKGWIAESPDVVLVSPFEIAREALAGERQMQDALVRVRAEGRPVFLVENFSEKTRGRVRRFLFGVAGIEAEAPSIDDLRKAFARFPDNTAVALELFRRARSSGDGGLQVGPAMSLVDAMPTSGDAFMMLAEGLSDARRGDEAIAAARRALELAPADGRMALRHAHILLDQNKLAEARAEYARALTLPGGPHLADEVRSRITLIDDIERGRRQ